MSAPPHQRYHRLRCESEGEALKIASAVARYLEAGGVQITRGRGPVRIWKRPASERNPILYLSPAAAIAIENLGIAFGFEAGNLVYSLPEDGELASGASCSPP